MGFVCTLAAYMLLVRAKRSPHSGNRAGLHPRLFCNKLDCGHSILICVTLTDVATSVDRKTNEENSETTSYTTVES